MDSIDEDLDALDSDLDALRSDSSSGAGNTNTTSGQHGQSNKTTALDEIDALRADADGQEAEGWTKRLKYGLYVVVMFAIVNVVAGPFTIPDSTVLVVFSLGFLALGGWAAYNLHDKIDEWRDSYNF